MLGTVMIRDPVKHKECIQFLKSESVGIYDPYYDKVVSRGFTGELKGKIPFLAGGLVVGLILGLLIGRRGAP